MLDANTGLPVAGAVSLSRSDAFLNLQTDGTERLASGVRKVTNADGSATYYLNLPAALAGTPVYLSFDLLGFGAAQSSVALRDIRVFSDPVAHDDALATDEDHALAGNVLGNHIAATEGMTSELVAPPQHGDLTLNADGSFSYVPHVNYYGEDSFSYRVTDAEGRTSNTATVQLTVHAVNDAPTLLAATPGEIMAGRPYTFDPLASASDPEGSPLSIEWLSTPAHGTLVAHADGSYTYTPSIDYIGADSFSWRVSDGEQASEPVTLSLNVLPANTAPVAGDAELHVAEDSTLHIDLTALGTDAEGDPLTAAIVTPPTHGTLLALADGSWLYTPTTNYHGLDTLSYTLSDGSLVSNAATLTLVVDPVNDAPVARDGTATLAEDGTLVIDLRTLGEDVEGATLDAVIAAAPAHGTLSRNADGTYTYVPAADFHGTDTLRFRLRDDELESNEATLTLQVAAVNDAPHAADLAATLGEDGSATLNPLQVALDADGDPLAPEIVSAPSHGIVLLHADGRFSYVPAPDFNGTDSFSYRVSDGQAYSALATVTLTITSVNDAPVARDLALTVAGNASATFALTATDVDSPAGELSYTIVTGPQHGSVERQADGSWRYTPESGYSGTDSFTYQAHDGQLGSSAATVAVTVTPPPALDIDLGIAGRFNVFVFGDFTSTGSDVEGAIAVGHDLTLSNYSVNANSLAYEGLSAVVGGSLTFYGGSLHGRCLAQMRKRRRRCVHPAAC